MCATAQSKALVCCILSVGRRGQGLTLRALYSRISPRRHHSGGKNEFRCQTRHVAPAPINRCPHRSYQQDCRPYVRRVVDVAIRLLRRFRRNCAKPWFAGPVWRRFQHLCQYFGGDRNQWQSLFFDRSGCQPDGDWYNRTVSTDCRAGSSGCLGGCERPTLYTPPGWSSGRHQYWGWATGNISAGLLLQSGRTGYISQRRGES